MTALVHGLLAFCALVSAALLIRAGGRACVLAALGLFVVGAAGLLGVLVSVGFAPLADAQRGLQAVAELVGLPLVAVGHLDATWGRRDVPVVLIAVVGLTGGAALLGGFPVYQVGVGVLGMLGVLAAARAHLLLRNQPTAARVAMGGAVLVAVARLMGREGLLGDVERLLLHQALLATGVVLLSLSLIVLSPPATRTNARRRA